MVPFIWEMVGFLFVVLSGCLLHFVYDWSGKNRLVGLVSPVNESTWEHLKLLFFPMLLFSIIEFFACGCPSGNFISAKAFGMLIGMIAIVTVFYTYTGIFGKHYLWADIVTFIFGVSVAYWYSGWAIMNKGDNLLPGILLTVVLVMSFFIFTFDPPRLALFLDPVTKSYGIQPRTDK